MATTKLKKRALDAFVMMFVIAAILHFGHRALLGESGQFARWDVEREIRALEAEQAMLRTELEELTNLTKRLSPEYLDLDLLDERARTMLGYVREDEVVIR